MVLLGKVLGLVLILQLGTFAESWRSCLEYRSSTGVKENGFFYVAKDGLSRGFTVYCDFTSEPGMAWTLVMSYSLRLREMAAFHSEPLHKNAPVNERVPNWEAYRLSHEQMEQVKNASTSWRITCNYEEGKLMRFEDYVRGKFSDVDVMTFNESGTCQKVDYISIEHYAAAAYVEAPFWQSANEIFHMKVSEPSASECLFKRPDGRNKDLERFGHFSRRKRRYTCGDRFTLNSNMWFGAEYLP